MRNVRESVHANLCELISAEHTAKHRETPRNAAKRRDKHRETLKKHAQNTRETPAKHLRNVSGDECVRGEG